jgi:hypothetical protein
MEPLSRFADPPAYLTPRSDPKRQKPSPVFPVTPYDSGALSKGIAVSSASRRKTAAS